MNGSDDEQIREIVCDYQRTFASVLWQLTRGLDMYHLFVFLGFSFYSVVMLALGLMIMIPDVSNAIASIIIALN